MKHSEIYDKHTDRRAFGKKKKGRDSIDKEARARRVNFKNYVRELEEEFLYLESEEDEDQSDEANK